MFTFPLLATTYGFDYTEIGVLGLFISIPFILVSALQERISAHLIRVQALVAAFSLTVASLLFMIYSSTVFVIALGIVSTIQAFFWVSVEVMLGYSEDPMSSEKYSSAWGIPNFAMPSIAGVVAQISGFIPIFLYSSAFFLAAGLFIPTPTINRIAKSKKVTNWLFVLPMLFAGISSGFYSYVMIPFFRYSGYSYFSIGIASSVPTLVTVLGFIILTLRPMHSIVRNTQVSSALILVPVLLIFYHPIWFIVAAASIASAGVAIAFGRILSYISRDASPERGVFYYESFFGTGFLTGSVVGSLFFQYSGFVAVLPLFIPCGVYLAYVTLKKTGGKARFKALSI